MDPNQVSASAMISAFVRAHHATHDDPKIFDDFLALSLFSPEQRVQFESNLSQALQFFDPQRAAQCTDPSSALAAFTRVQSGPIVLSRARYTEDALSAWLGAGERQYVILGAGLDTFVFRRPDLLPGLRVFEVDLPGTQNYKRQRQAELGWAEPPQASYLPVDFMHQNAAEVLLAAGFNRQALTFFSWLGVTYYLSRDVVFETLRSLAAIAPAGSVIVFDYLDTQAFIPEKTAERVKRMQAATQMAGEPMTSGFEPETLGADLDPLGLRLTENLGPADLQARYFASRTDGFHAFEHIHFAWVEVKS